MPKQENVQKAFRKAGKVIEHTVIFRKHNAVFSFEIYFKNTVLLKQTFKAFQNTKSILISKNEAANIWQQDTLPFGEYSYAKS